MTSLTNDVLTPIIGAIVGKPNFNDLTFGLGDGVVAYEHPVLGTVRQAATPLRLSGDLPVARRAPFLGEHTDELLRDVLGYEDARIAGLREAGAFGAVRAPAP